MTSLREFSSADELMTHYRDLRARTRAWAPRPAPPPLPPPAAPVTPAQSWTPTLMTPMGRIMRAVAEEFEIQLVVIRSRSRVATTVLARHVVCLLAKELTNMSSNQIAKMVGDIDHSTVISAISSARSKMHRDPALADRVQRLRDKLLERGEDIEG